MITLQSDPASTMAYLPKHNTHKFNTINPARYISKLRNIKPHLYKWKTHMKGLNKWIKSYYGSKPRHPLFQGHTVISSTNANSMELARALSYKLEPLDSISASEFVDIAEGTLLELRDGSNDTIPSHESDNFNCHDATAYALLTSDLLIMSYVAFPRGFATNIRNKIEDRKAKWGKMFPLHNPE